MLKSKVIGLSVFALVAGIFMVSGEDASAMQKEKMYKMKMPKAGMGKTHGHSQVVNTECWRVHKGSLMCKTEIETTIGEQ